MITLKQLFDDLAYGELAGMSMGNSVVGSITAAQYPKIISATNLGLIDLYKRFHIKEKECKVHQHADVNVYYLRSEHIGVVGSMTDDLYIEDSDDDHFEDDVLKVTEAYDEDEVPVPVNNNAYRSTGIFTPSHDVIKMVPADPVKVISIVYRARYPEIFIADDFDPADVDLYIPDAIREALLLNIASRVFSSKASKNAEGVPNFAMSFQFRYDSLCKQLENESVFQDVNDTHNNFESKGWR